MIDLVLAVVFGVLNQVVNIYNDIKSKRTIKQ